MKYANEFDCDNNQDPLLYNVANLANSFLNEGKWCLDIVNLGPYMNNHAIVIRGNGANTQGVAFYNGIQFESGAHNAAFNVVPSDGQNVGIAYSIQSFPSTSGTNEVSEDLRDWSATNGAIWARMSALSGIWQLGSSAAVSSPGLEFLSSGAGLNNFDSSIIASGGTGTLGSGTITLNGTLNVTAGLNINGSPGVDGTTCTRWAKGLCVAN